jgi:HK97 family phage portal protein
MIGALKRMIGIETRAAVSTKDPYLGEFLSGRGLGGTPSPYLAENLSTWLAGVSAISSAIAATPAYVYRRTDGGREIDDRHPLQRLIDTGPNPHQSWTEFVEFLVASAINRGNGLAETVIDGNGAVTELRPFPWANVAPLVTQSGALVFDVTDGTTLGGPQRKRRLLESEVLLLKDRSDDGYIGRSRLSRAAPVINTALAGQEMTDSIYRTGGFPSGAIVLDGKLGAIHTDHLRATLQQTVEGARRAGRIMIFEKGIEWKQFSINPEDAELLASRRFGTEEIARLLNMPPPLVGIWDHSSFTNSETAGRWFAQHTLRPWIRKLEAALARACFTETEAKTYSIEFDLSDLLRGDPETRWRSNQIAVDSGILTPNEVREQEGWNPRPDGEGLKSKPAAPATPPVVA